MSDSRASACLDRLPWLADEPKLQPQAVRRDLTGWAVAAVLLVAGLFFWLGSKNEAVQQRRILPPAVTTVLPPPTPPQQVRMAPQPEVAPTPMPEVRDFTAPEVRIAPPPRRAIRHELARHAASAVKPTSEAGGSVVAPSVPIVANRGAFLVTHSAPLRVWPSRVTFGAYGRLVQIGAYGSRLQAKRGWVAMVRAYPAIAHLQAVVVETRNSHRRSFYRFQIGTTSQAHSEVLCQRLEKIQLSCAIIGLPWKAKIER
jgi:hypothetical protein